MLDPRRVRSRPDRHLASLVNGQKSALQAYCRDELACYQLVVASNRGPVEFTECAGHLSFHKGQGGLVSALSSLVEVTDIVWVATARGELEARLAREGGGRLAVEVNDHPLDVSFVAPSPTQYHQHYDMIANTVLWFLQHHISNPPIHPSFDAALWQAWSEGYVVVNQMFADHLVDLVALEPMGGRRPLIMVHDYHLYLVPGMVRKQRPDALIQHFTHIAWPGPEQWRQLPPPIREAILENMLGCDVLGFHCRRYAANFLRTCSDLMRLPIDWDNREVILPDRRVRVRDYPISIDPAGLHRLAESPLVTNLEAGLLKGRPAKLIVQVARTDPSKNILRSFQAYEVFLEQFPAFHGTVQLLGLLPVSRQTTELYKEYLEELIQVAKRLDQAFGDARWRPIALFFEHDYHRAIAALKHYDILLVNSIADGMNLVAKEGPIVNQRNGVLIISEAAGVADELGEAAIVVNPFDLVGMAAAFHKALTMTPRARVRALALQRESICSNTVFNWAHHQLRDLIGPLAFRRTVPITLFPPSIVDAEVPPAIPRASWEVSP